MPDYEEYTAKVCKLNDKFRRTGIGGKMYVSQGVAALPLHEILSLIFKARSLETFDKANDPYGEHDFAVFSLGDKTAYFKIDYYNNDLTGSSEDPSDPLVTTRVMTLMLDHEY